MPWKETTAMSQRLEFVERVLQEDLAFSALCREFGVSRTTGYKWLKRYENGGEGGLLEQSRRAPA